MRYRLVRRRVSHVQPYQFSRWRFANKSWFHSCTLEAWERGASDGGLLGGVNLHADGEGASLRRAKTADAHHVP